MKRRKRLAPVSTRVLSYREELKAMGPSVLARAEHRCEICRVNPVDHVHHKLRRGQGGTNELSNLLGLCHTCHALVHDNPAVSFEKGWLVRRGLTNGYKA